MLVLQEGVNTVAIDVAGWFVVLVGVAAVAAWIATLTR
jgi:hypothetical protein